MEPCSALSRREGVEFEFCRRGLNVSMSAEIVELNLARQVNNRAEQILTEATILFSQNGYAGTRMSDIAAAIGVTKPIVYRHFESKQVLFEALVRRVLLEQIQDVCRRIDNHRGPTSVLLGQLVRDAYDGLRVPGALAPWRIAVGEADRFPDLAAFLNKDFMEPLLRSLMGLFSRALEAGELRGTDAETLARLFCSPVASVGMLLATFGEHGPNTFNVEAFFDAHVEGFVRAWSLKSSS